MNISGWKWADITNTGEWDDPEEGVLNGFTIVLDTDDDFSNGYLRINVTGSVGIDGAYAFDDISLAEIMEFDPTATTLYVYELPETNFVQTYGGFSVSIESGLVIDGEYGVAEDGNFGNQGLEGANRTPGFWQSTLGQSFYDGDPDNQGDANGDGVPDGQKDFENEGWSSEDLLLKYGFDMPGVLVDGNWETVEEPYHGKGFPTSDNLTRGDTGHGDLPDDDDGDGDYSDSSDEGELADHFLVWDENGNGVYDSDADIALTFEELLVWVEGGYDDPDAKGKGGGRDYIEILQRDVAAVYLNTLNNSSLAGLDDPVMDEAIEDYYAAAINFILNVGGSKKDQRDAWAEYGAEAHEMLDAYNNNGLTYDPDAELMVQTRVDGDTILDDTYQNWLEALDAYDAAIA